MNANIFWLGWALTKRELAQRYRGTFLGILWPILYGLLFLTIFAFVFSVLLKVRWAGGDVKMGAIMIFCGLVPYLFLAETLGRSPTLVAGAKGMVRSAGFPVPIIAVVAVNGVFVILLLNIVLLLGFAFIQGTARPVSILIYLALLIPLYLLGLAIVWFIGALAVFFRDLTQIAPILAQVLMFMAPVFYPLSIVPDQFAPIFALNPLTYFAVAFRDGLSGSFDGSAWMTVTTIFAALAALAAWFFQRLRPAFGDVL